MRLNHIRCDGCGREISEPEPSGWLHAEFSIYKQTGSFPVDFCSYACVVRYGHKQAETSGEDARGGI